MPTYILLSTLTVQGVQTLKSNPERLRAVNQDVEELGCRVLHQWATLGEFDFINVVDAPDTQAIARVSVALAARGSTRIETLPALTIDEFLEQLSSSRAAPAERPDSLTSVEHYPQHLAEARQRPAEALGPRGRPGTPP